MKRLLLITIALGFGLSAQTQTPAEDAERWKQRAERAEKTLQDWPNLGRYRAENGQVSGAEVVFLGDSITDGWGRRYGQFFPGKAYVNRGISGQTTPQMVLRFRADVLAHHPKVVVLLAGTNDIAGNTGPMTLEMIEDNYRTMAELAKAHGIKMVFSSVMPVCDYHRNQTERRSPEKIVALNEWLKSYCRENGLVYLDYYSAMLDEAKMLRKELTGDGLHPNEAGYAVMGPLAEKAIAAALAGGSGR